MDARVGPYRIVRLVNRGGQGSVYLGYDERLRRRVAIKIYPLPSGRAARRQVLHEARVVASMHSPKIVQIHDVIQSSEHLAMVMEYAPGCDLEEFLGAVRPSLASTLTIGADIAGALAVARQQHLVHGDLKAANVLITEAGRVKLTDFGIARHPHDPDDVQLAGSLTALSPEQYLGKSVDIRSDLFALGCLLYRMLSGVQPFVRNGKLDVRRLLEQAPPPLAELVPGDVELPPELIDLVTALLQKDPRLRPANTRVVRQVLRRAARALPLAATSSLLQEARPCFRQESSEDIPPSVPQDLGRGGRSRLFQAESGGLRMWRTSGPSRGYLAGAAALALMAGLVLTRQPGETPVHIDEPVLRLATDAELPEEISRGWLVEEVIGAVTERLGPLRVTGPVGATPVTTLNSRMARGGKTETPERLRLDLRCADLFCVFAVSRDWQGQQVNRQAVLFPDMPTRQWRDIIRSTTLALYP